MKLSQLFEATTPKFTAQIYLGHSDDVSNLKDAPSRQAVEAFEKKAKEKFKELKDKHPTKLRFATIPEANEYMKTMELDWPLSVWRIHGNHSKTKKAKVDWSGWVEPAAETADDIQITDLGDGRVMISVKAKTGPLLSIINSTAFIASRAKKKLQNSLGKTITTVSTFRSNKLIITATKDEAEQYLAKAKKDHKEWDDRKAQRTADKNDPVKKKEANKFNYEMQKRRKQELYDRYGKDIVERVKIKSLTHIDGDDGYQWSLWVDGRRQQSGMTYDQALGEQRMMWSYLLKVSKMTPEELKKEADIARGWQAFFMLQRLEVELDSYLHQMNKSAKKFVDAANQTKSAIRKAAGAKDPAEEMEALIAKLRKRM